jgi:hypothetical protein
MSRHHHINITTITVIIVITTPIIIIPIKNTPKTKITHITHSFFALPTARH